MWCYTTYAGRLGPGNSACIVYNKPYAGLRRVTSRVICREGGANEHMGMRRIATSSTWSSFITQDERSESVARDSNRHFEALYQRYYPGVLAFLRFLVGTPEVAE